MPNQDKGNWEFKLSDYVHLIREECASCGAYMKWSLHRYKTRGNYCLDCEMALNKAVKERKKRERENRDLGILP